MNGIVRLKHIIDYRKVSYYSICIDREDESVDTVESLFEEFIRIQTEKNGKRLNHILKWLAEIGDKYGAKDSYFRDEQAQGEAMGLPPYDVNHEPTYTEDGEPAPNNLRLYCHRLNEHVVILFSGDLKTEAKAQDCPAVKSHFSLANQLTRIIDQAFKEGEIRWVEDDTDISFDEDLILYL